MSKNKVETISKGHARKMLEPISGLMEPITITGINHDTDEPIEIIVNGFHATKHKMEGARYRIGDTLSMVEDNEGTKHSHKVGKNTIEGVSVPSLLTGKRSGYGNEDGNPLNNIMANIASTKKIKTVTWCKS